jgi:putative two-component system response regulator
MSLSGIKDSKILVIDDNEMNLVMVQRILEWAGYRSIQLIKNPNESLAKMREFRPDLVILDLHMPEKSGYDVLAEIKADSPANLFVPILVFTADNTKLAREKALELGASDFLTKPGDSSEILLRVQNFLKTRRMQLQIMDHAQTLSDRVKERTKELEESRFETLACLAKAADYRDDETGQHAHRVGSTSGMIAKALGWSPERVHDIELAAPLHDLGKIGIPDSILRKPGRLDQAELDTMRTHPAIGGEILAGAKSPILVLAREVALYHHERWDGNGYPHKLIGDSIPLSARIVAVADAYDAMTSDRPYKKAISKEKALEEILKCSGGHFDPQVVEAFGTVHTHRRIKP